MAAAAPSSGSSSDIRLYKAMDVRKRSHIEELLVPGANLGAVDKNGENFFHHLVKPSPLSYADRLELFNRGLAFVDPSTLPSIINHTTREGFTPLHYAILYSNHKEILPLLDGFLRIGADVNQLTGGKTALTPLMLTVQSPNAGLIAERLLEHGADMTQADAQGRTVLHQAMLAPNYELLSVLLGPSSNDRKPHWTNSLLPGNVSSLFLYAKDRHGKTALDYMHTIRKKKMTPHIEALMKKAIQRWQMKGIMKAAPVANEEKEEVPGSVAAAKASFATPTANGNNTAMVLAQMMGRTMGRMKAVPVANEEKEEVPGSVAAAKASFATPTANGNNTAMVLAQMMGRGRRTRHLRSTRRHLKRKLRRTVRVSR